MNMLLAQSTSLDGAMSEGLGIIAKFLYIIAVIVIAHGGWQVRTGNADMGKMSIVGGLLLGLAVVIADALFQAGGMPTITNRKMSKPVINTHAGDDSDGKLWGIEGINILFILAGLLLSVGLSLMLFRQQAHSAAFSFGVGSLPLVLACVYVFALRQGRPRSYDTDLLETLLAGRAWLPPRRQPRHPIHRP